MKNNTERGVPSGSRGFLVGAILLLRVKYNKSNTIREIQIYLREYSFSLFEEEEVLEELERRYLERNREAAKLSCPVPQAPPSST